MTSAIFAYRALLPGGWVRNVRIEWANGVITAVTPGALPEASDDRQETVLPGLVNLHSHAFQRGMAGLAEVAGPAADTFWTWRDVMYRFALAMTPEQMEAIAAQAYVEMLESGFTRVGEFHYLHHDPAGNRYADIAASS
jgi:cytosine/adenosine deaminase-related metal-dependent hydrolase